MADIPAPADRPSGLSAGRALLLVALFGAWSLVVGGLLAPPLFNLIVRLGRTVPALEILRDIEFERIAYRMVMLAALAGLYPLARAAGMADWARLGLTKDAAWLRPWGRGMLLGAGSMLVLFGAGWALRAYWLAEADLASVAGLALGTLAGALLVGVFEETLFRGLLFGILRRGLGFWGGAVLASVIFSALHFAPPSPLRGVVYGHWYSGFSMAPYLFGSFGFNYHSYPFCLTLFAMGLALCVFYGRYGSLYFVMGLHSGWVWIIAVGSEVFERNIQRLPFLFGKSEVVSKSWIALFTIALFLLWGLALRPARREG